MMKNKNCVLRSLAFPILLLSFSSGLSAQDAWGIGLRFGDPSGISVKKYMSGKAMELSIGRTHWFYNDNWYYRRFGDWYEAKKYRYRDVNFLAYNVSVPIGVQFHYLFREGINKSTNLNVTGLEWYYGFGAQLRFQDYRYNYRYRLEGGSNWYVATSDRIIDLDLGADITIGLEYTFKAPISLFVDLSLFMELFDNPFLFGLQGGLGGRFNF